VRGTAAAVPPPFRPRNPALCGSCPLVTPYYCRLWHLLCLLCNGYLYTFFVCVFSVFFMFFCIVFLCSFLLQYFDTVGWVFCPVKTVSHITYTVLAGDVKHCSILSNTLLQCFFMAMLISGGGESTSTRWLFPFPVWYVSLYSLKSCHSRSLLLSTAAESRQRVPTES